MKKILVFLAFCSPWATGAAMEPPVTQAEASAVFVRADQLIKSVLQIKTAAPAFPSSGGIVTRAQILHHFATILDMIQPKLKFTPPKLPAAPGAITLKDPTARRLAQRLETLGFIDRYGPLATSKTEGIQPHDFGDALGYFLARIAEVTHTPTTKFSPYLMPP